MMKNTVLTTYFEGVRALIWMPVGLPSAIAFADAVGDRKTGMVFAAFAFT